FGLPASLFAQDATPTVPPGVTVHVVQRGETLFRIALSYGLTTDELAQLNNITDPSMIAIGQRLLVPVPGAAPAQVQMVMHIVQPGESIDSIAALYGLTGADLKAKNHLTDDADSFYVGQLLDVSVSAETTPEAASPEPTLAATDLPAVQDSLIVHRVTRGETIFRIASEYGVSVNAIVQANQIADPEMIYAGQDLVIPGIQAPKIALDVPAMVQSLDIAPLLFVEGETGRIHLTTSSGIKVSGTFIGETLHDASGQDDSDHTLLVGIPVGTAAEVDPISLILTDGAGTQTPLTINVQIISGNYGWQSIQLMAGLEDLLDPKLQNDELAQLQSITSNFTPTRYFEDSMGLPVAAPLSASFGATRSYNGGVLDSIHTGTDFAAATGTPILAPAAGKVVFVGYLDIRGNVTIIDHGWGVFTVYCHQSQQSVQVGDTVATGQVIGATGSTGRVTGPHLHWELWVDGVVVDAMQWVNDSFFS
ncbi:MAG: LysM peptidoglycan-binding domain-containing protein, partial [Chloroflexota bacterium]